MARSLIEVDTSPGNLDELTKSLSEAVTAATPQTQDTDTQSEDTQAAVQQNDETLPAKLRGKSVAEIAGMFQNLESAYGRMANDLGQQRKLTDRLLDLKRTEDLTRNTPEDAKVDRAKLLEDPTAELTRFVDARTAGLESESKQRLQQLEAALAQQEFVRKHPDYQTVANDPSFVEWINASRLRSRTAAQARNGDWGAADELLEEFKQTAKPAAATGAPDVDKAKASSAGVEAAKRAALETSTSADDATGKAKKVYRRSDLLALKLQRPDTYYADDFQTEILRAYAEGRVK